MPRTLDPAEHRAALEALVNHLGEEPDLDEVVAAESQLFPGVLMIGSGVAFFLCRRFGAWEVTNELPIGELKGVDAVPSFGAQGHEVRLLHNGRLIRFSDLDEETAKRIGGVLERGGGEGLDARLKARRARVSAGRPASAPSAQTSLPAPAWSKDPPSSPFVTSIGAPTPFGSSASAIPPSSSFSSSPVASSFTSPPTSPFSSAPAGVVGRPLRDDEIGAVSDDDDVDDEDDDDDDVDDDLEALADMEAQEAALLARLQQPAQAAKEKTEDKPAAPKRKILLPTILVAVAYGVVSPLIYEVGMEIASDEPEIGLYLMTGLHWSLVGLCGGLFGRGLAMGLGLSVLGMIAGVVCSQVAREVYTPEVSQAIGYVFLGYGYVAGRSGGSPFYKAMGVMIAALILGNMFDLRGDAISVGVSVAIFWALHFLLERIDQK